MAAYRAWPGLLECVRVAVNTTSSRSSGMQIGARGCSAVAAAMLWGDDGDMGARLETLDLSDNAAGDIPW